MLLEGFFVSASPCCVVLGRDCVVLCVVGGPDRSGNHGILERINRQRLVEIVAGCLIVILHGSFQIVTEPISYRFRRDSWNPANVVYSRHSHVSEWIVESRHSRFFADIIESLGKADA